MGLVSHLLRSFRYFFVWQFHIFILCCGFLLTSPLILLWNFLNLKIFIPPPLPLILESPSSLFLQIYSPLLFSPFLRFLSSENQCPYFCFQYLSILPYYSIFITFPAFFSVRSSHCNLPIDDFILLTDSFYYLSYFCIQF